MADQKGEEVLLADVVAVLNRIGRRELVIALERLLTVGVHARCGSEVRPGDIGVGVIEGVDSLCGADRQPLDRREGECGLAHEIGLRAVVGVILVEFVQVVLAFGTPRILPLHVAVGYRSVLVADELVGGIVRHARDGEQDGRIHVPAGLDGLVFGVGKRDIGSEFEPGGDLRVEVGAEREAVDARIDLRGTLLGVVAQRSVVGGRLRGAAHRGVCLHERCGVVEQIVGPVEVDVVAQQERFLGLIGGVVFQCRAAELLECEQFARIHHLHVVIGQHGDTVLGAERYLRLVALLAFLGRDVDHAVGCARTVDGRRRGVFEDRDILDVLRVDLRKN